MLSHVSKDFISYLRKIAAVFSKQPLCDYTSVMKVKPNCTVQRRAIQEDYAEKSLAGNKLAMLIAKKKNLPRTE